MLEAPPPPHTRGCIANGSPAAPNRDSNDDVLQLLTEKLYNKRHVATEEGLAPSAEGTSDMYTKVGMLLEKACAELDVRAAGTHTHT